MPGNRDRFVAWAACALLLGAGGARGQENGAAAASAELANQVHTLSETVRQLQAQVQSLNSRLNELRPREENQGTDPSSPPSSSRAQPMAATSGSNDPYLTFPAANPANSGCQLRRANRPRPDERLEQRLSQLEDDQDLTDSRLADQDQTKVESGSKYRLRLSGLVLLNMFENRGVVDNADTPGDRPSSGCAGFGRNLRGLAAPIADRVAGLWPGPGRGTHERRHQVRLCRRIPEHAERHGDGPGAAAHRNGAAGLGEYFGCGRARLFVLLSLGADFSGAIRGPGAVLCRQSVGLDAASPRRAPHSFL